MLGFFSLKMIHSHRYLFLIYIYIYVHIHTYEHIFNVYIYSPQILTWISYPWGFPTKEKGTKNLDLQISIHPKIIPHFSGGKNPRATATFGSCSLWPSWVASSLASASYAYVALPLEGPRWWKARKIPKCRSGGLGVLKKLGLQLGKSHKKVNIPGFIDRNLLQNGNFRNYTIQNIEWFFLQDFPALKPPWNGWHDRVLGWKNQNGVHQYFICK